MSLNFQQHLYKNSSYILFTYIAQTTILSYPPTLSGPVLYRIDQTEFGTGMGLVRDNVLRLLDPSLPQVCCTVNTGPSFSVRLARYRV